MSQFSHLNAAGEARMVDISEKPDAERVARAEASVELQPETLDAIFGGGVAKGDVLAVARVAGIQGAKRTAESDSAVSSAGVDEGQRRLRAAQGTRLFISSTECKVTGPDRRRNGSA